MKYVNNAFSTKLLRTNGLAIIQNEISKEEFLHETHQDDIVSCIGHEDTAKLFNLPCNRTTIELVEDDTLYVCELNNPAGTRLPAGITEIKELPEGFYFRFLKLEVKRI